MEWIDGLGDTSIDEIFNFNSQAQGGKKKKRSSILKQSKYLNGDFIENEDTDHCRKSQLMKRVSFADTFQVKELHTGNIYDIPGWNESENSSSVLGTFHEIDSKSHSLASEQELASNLKNQLQCNISSSIHCSAFRPVGSDSLSVNNSQAGNCSIDSQKNLLCDGRYTQHFASQDMEFTCVKSNFHDASEPELASNSKNHSQYTSSSNHRSAFRTVGSESLSVSNSQAGNCSISSQKNFPRDGKYTQHFASQDMELTCVKSNFQDATLRSQTDYDGDLREPPYFQLQEIPLVGSPDLENMSQSGRMGGKMFKLCTDNFSFSKASTKETRKRPLSLDASKNNSFDSLSNVVEDTSAKGKSVLDTDSSLLVGTSNMPRSVEVEKHFVKPQKDSSALEMSIGKRKLQSRTPGVVYNIRRIRQAIKESGNHIVLFPELSQVMKRQKFNFKHPYSDMKIASPVCNPEKLSRSFHACSRETSFTCLPHGSSVRSSIEPSPSVLPEVLDLSPRKSLLSNSSKAIQESLGTSKVDAMPNSEQPSGMDESLQLLPYSVLESSYLDAASKNFTICLDKSDFVAKEPCSSASPECCSLLVQDSVNVSVQNKIEIPQTDSLLQDNLSLVHASQDKSEEMNQTSAVDNETSITRDAPSIPSEIDKSLKITSVEDNDSGNAVTLPDLPSQNSEQQADMLKSFAARILENDLSFPIRSLRSDSLEGTLSTTQNINTPSSKQGMSTPSKIPRLKCQMKESVKIHISKKNKTPTREDCIHPVTSTTLTSSNADVSSNVLDDINVTSISLETVIQGEAPSLEDSVHNADVPVNALEEVQKLKVTIQVGDLPKKLENADVTQPTPSEESESEEVLKNRVKRPENCESPHDGKSSVPGGSLFPLNLNYWKEKFEKASSGEGMRWKTKSLSEDHAVFEIFWRVYVFECTLRVEVKRIGASQSTISFTPTGMNVTRKVVTCTVHDIQDRTYSYFNYLVTDTVLPFTICCEHLIEKLAEYSQVAKDVETLMRDILKLGVAGTHTVSYELDPLKVYFQVINENYECILDMTFLVDLKKYPRERIIPELKHLYCKDITKEVAVSCVEPGKDYLIRMVNAARDLKP